jgi:hypothetical protein
MAVDLDPDKVRSWTALRAYWRVVRGPCGRCGGVIHYDEPRYRVGWRRRVIAGQAVLVRTRIENPWALDVDHILGRDIDPRQCWAPVDTRPTHSRCNRRAGAAYGNRKRGQLSRLSRRSAARASVVSGFTTSGRFGAMGRPTG